MSAKIVVGGVGDGEIIELTSFQDREIVHPSEKAIC